MNDFKSLTAALENWFDKPLCDLPEELRERARHAVFPNSWDGLNSDQRRSLAQQWDCQNDPAMAPELDFWWQFFKDKYDIEQEIEDWEAVATPRGEDLGQQKTNLAKLRKDLACKEEQENRLVKLSKELVSAQRQKEIVAELKKELVRMEQQEAQTLNRGGPKSLPESEVSISDSIGDTKSPPLEQFRSMENLRFDEVTIKADPENIDLRVSARGKQTIAPFSALGLTHKNQITLNVQGELFFKIANGGTPGKSDDRALARLSQALREAFDTKDPPYSTGRQLFRFTVPKDRRAKEKALRTMSSYNDSQGSQDYLRKNDDECDEDNPMYGGLEIDDYN